MMPKPDPLSRTRDPPSSTCCCPPPLARRHLLGLGLAAIPAAFFPSLGAAADYGSYEATLLTCIDPRFIKAAGGYMAGRHWAGKYSQFSFAGAAIGAVAPKFATWHQTYWDNLQVTVGLHHVKTVVALNHRDCGAAKLAYGDAAVGTPEAEAETHRKALADFRREVTRRHPNLQVVTGLIARDGKVEMVG